MSQLLTDDGEGASEVEMAPGGGGEEESGGGVEGAALRAERGGLTPKELGTSVLAWKETDPSY